MREIIKKKQGGLRGEIILCDKDIDKYTSIRDNILQDNNDFFKSALASQIEDFKRTKENLKKYIELGDLMLNFLKACKYAAEIQEQTPSLYSQFNHIWNLPLY